jgi:hypothetical protein
MIRQIFTVELLVVTDDGYPLLTYEELRNTLRAALHKHAVKLALPYSFDRTEVVSVREEKGD